MVDQDKRDPANEQSSIGSAANNRTSAEYAAAESMPLGRRSKSSSRPKSGREGGQTALQRQAAAAALAAQTAAAAAAAAASAAASAAAAAAAAEAAADEEAYKPARPRSVEGSHRPSRHRTGSEPNSYKKRSTKSLQGPVLAKVGSAPEMLHSVELEVSTLNTMQEGELDDSDNGSGNREEKNQKKSQKGKKGEKKHNSCTDAMIICGVCCCCCAYVSQLMNDMDKWT